MNVPRRDRFHVVSEHAANRLRCDQSYLGVISLVESTREDRSFGNGIAQYVVLSKEEWK